MLTNYFLVGAVIILILSIGCSYYINQQINAINDWTISLNLKNKNPTDGEILLELYINGNKHRDITLKDSQQIVLNNQIPDINTNQNYLSKNSINSIGLKFKNSGDILVTPEFTPKKIVISKNISGIVGNPQNIITSQVNKTGNSFEFKYYKPNSIKYDSASKKYQVGYLLNKVGQNHNVMVSEENIKCFDTTCIKGDTNCQDDRETTSGCPPMTKTSVSPRPLGLCNNCSESSQWKGTCLTGYKDDTVCECTNKKFWSAINSKDPQKTITIPSNVINCLDYPYFVISL